MLAWDCSRTQVGALCRPPTSEKWCTDISSLREVGDKNCVETVANFEDSGKPFWLTLLSGKGVVSPSMLYHGSNHPTIGMRIEASTMDQTLQPTTQSSSYLDHQSKIRWNRVPDELKIISAQAIKINEITPRRCTLPEVFKYCWPTLLSLFCRILNSEVFPKNQTTSILLLIWTKRGETVCHIGRAGKPCWIFLINRLVVARDPRTHSAWFTMRKRLCEDLANRPDLHIMSNSRKPV